VQAADRARADDDDLVATEASAKPTPSGMRLSPLTASTLAGTIMYSAKPPSYWKPMDSWFGHTVIRPRRHSRQVPSGIAAITWTRSPGAQPSTPGPTSVICPAISCPMTRGGEIR
jgi:hypothetical protein